MYKVLILCTGNSCRSQMAEGFLQAFDDKIEVISAGTVPAATVHPKAVSVMKEVGIDISLAVPKDVNKFINNSFDFVITVCDNAKENCPVFFGSIRNNLHIGFTDPAEATGTEDEIYNVFREVRDKIKDRFYKFYIQNLK